jgi:hypothetical protein
VRGRRLPARYLERRTEYLRAHEFSHGERYKYEERAGCELESSLWGCRFVVVAAAGFGLVRTDTVQAEATKKPDWSVLWPAETAALGECVCEKAEVQTSRPRATEVLRLLFGIVQR